MVAVDGSELSFEAFERATKLMRKDDKGYLLTVIEPIEVLPSSSFSLAFFSLAICGNYVYHLPLLLEVDNWLRYD